MFRNLIPLLQDRFHLIAPDLPGFGFTETPPRGQFPYTFDQLAKVIDQFTDSTVLSATPFTFLTMGRRLDCASH